MSRSNAIRGASEMPSALYWRGRIYEDEEHNFPQAVNYYRRLVERLHRLLLREPGATAAGGAGHAARRPPAPSLAAAQRPPAPALTGELPENDIHLIKARLLANAALNEYIGPEIHASPTSDEWGALAQAEIYVSYGEYTRALQSMKHSGISFFTLPMDQVPDGLLASALSAALLERAGGECGQQRSRPVPGGVADPAGVGVQRRSGQPRQRLWTDATAALGGQVDGEEAWA